MILIDKLHLRDPSAGARRMSKYLTRKAGTKIGRNRALRLMQVIGIEAIYPRKRSTIPGGHSGIYPYRLDRTTRPGTMC